MTPKQKAEIVAAVSCERCHAPRGQRCVNPSSGYIRIPHLARRDAAHAAGAYAVR